MSAAMRYELRDSLTDEVEGTLTVTDGRVVKATGRGAEYIAETYGGDWRQINGWCDRTGRSYLRKVEGDAS